VIVCSIENLDPDGRPHRRLDHRGARADPLDVEYQLMRDAAFACIRRVGVETAAATSSSPSTHLGGDMVVIEMNPRVSRSSALASKATGFPIAKIAARLAVGLHARRDHQRHHGRHPRQLRAHDRLRRHQDPSLGVREFPGSPGVLGTSMQSVGEAMAIGRTFPESLQKALRSLETGRAGLNCDPGEAASDALDDDELVGGRRSPTPDRPFHLEAALRRGISVDRLYASHASTRGSSTRSAPSSRSGATWPPPG
jgi:carbamoyl-phosphate synthase large subunit